MADLAYVSRVRIIRQGGPQRLAYLPAEEQPVAFGVHDEVAATTASPQAPPTAGDDARLRRGGRRRLTDGHVRGRAGGAPSRGRSGKYEAEAVGEVENVDGVW